MIDIDNIRTTVVKGLKQYLGCDVIRGNQTAKIPAFPFVMYNITTLANEYNGTYGVYEDGVSRKPYKVRMSLTAHSDDYTQAVDLINKTREWLDCLGTVYLNDHDVIVESVGSVTDRSNILTVEYKYSYGFDCVFWTLDEVQETNGDYNDDYIETATINDIYITK